MSTETEELDLGSVESRAADNLAREDGRVEADLDAAAVASDAADEELQTMAPGRRTVAVVLPAAGAAALVGAVFSDYWIAVPLAVLAAVAGAVLAYFVSRLRTILLVVPAVVAGLGAAGVIAALVTGGPDGVVHVAQYVSRAVGEARLVRPPIQLTPGFAALAAWVCAASAFTATWTAVVVRRPTLGMLAPLPVAGLAAISIPHDFQVPAGLALVVLFAAGLGVLSGDRDVTGGARLPLAYELRRAAGAVPILLVVTVGLAAVAQTGLLFPKPLVNPQEQAQKPHTAPISDVPDRVLFDVRSSVTGPWVLGVLDTYDGTDWRLPAFSQARLEDIPRSGVVDGSLKPGLKATITVRGLGGAVMPTLPNTTAILAKGPRLNYDLRSGNIRLVEGEINNGYSYEVAAANLPAVADLQKAPDAVSPQLRSYTQLPAPPPAVANLVQLAPKTSKWDEFDYLRQFVLKNITATGAGSPSSIPTSRVQQILGGTKEASPFELVAIQVMLARWIGVPARIGYGFDGGEQVGDHIEVRPKNGAAFPEVYFGGYGWLPVIGVPAKAKVSDTSDPNQQQKQSGVAPSDDIAVSLYLPVEVPGQSLLADEIRQYALLGGLCLLAAALLYVFFPVFQKAFIRARRRGRALRAGPRARVIQAYAEWRDALTDQGYRYTTETPLGLLRRFPRDEEHSELAWLVTRALWGDLQEEVDGDVARDAEALSRSLRGRLAEAQPITVRAVAALSRLSLASPYEGPARPPRASRRRKKEVVHRVAV